MGRNYSPSARLEIEREKWRLENGVETVPVSTSATDRRLPLVFVPFQMELPFEEAVSKQSTGAAT
jgi:hypothetical protein